jgi:hypothetical protein
MARDPAKEVGEIAVPARWFRALQTVPSQGSPEYAALPTPGSGSNNVRYHSPQGLDAFSAPLLLARSYGAPRQTKLSAPLLLRHRLVSTPTVAA